MIIGQPTAMWCLDMWKRREECGVGAGAKGTCRSEESDGKGAAATKALNCEGELTDPMEHSKLASYQAHGRNPELQLDGITVVDNEGDEQLKSCGIEDDENPYETFNYGKLQKKPVDDDELSASGSSYYSTSSHLPCDLDSGSKSYLGKDDDKIQLVQSDEKGKGGNAENVERRKEENPYSREDGDGSANDDKDKEFHFLNAFGDSVLETVEFCFGVVFYAISYMRLWIISLAHSLLSEVCILSRHGRKQFVSKIWNDLV